MPGYTERFHGKMCATASSRVRYSQCIHCAAEYVHVDQTLGDSGIHSYVCISRVKRAIHVFHASIISSPGDERG